MSTNAPAQGGSASGGKKLIKIQFYILLLGTLFAWTNFGIEFVNWLNNKTNQFSCNPNIINPFLTPCFYGAIFFTIAFVLSALILKEAKDKNAAQ